MSILNAPSLQTQQPVYLSSEAAARLLGMPDSRRVGRNVTPDAWELGPNGKRWPLYKPETIEAYRAELSGGEL